MQGVIFYEELVKTRFQQILSFCESENCFNKRKIVFLSFDGVWFWRMETKAENMTSAWRVIYYNPLQI